MFNFDLAGNVGSFKYLLRIISKNANLDLELASNIIRNSNTGFSKLTRIVISNLKAKTKLTVLYKVVMGAKREQQQ